MLGAGIAGPAHTEISIVSTLRGGERSECVTVIIRSGTAIISVRIIITFFHDKPILASLSNIVRS